jgi:ketosteroid isomerase-like protein
VIAPNVETVRAYYEAAEKRDSAGMLELLHPDVELRLT